MRVIAIDPGKHTGLDDTLRGLVELYGAPETIAIREYDD